MADNAQKSPKTMVFGLFLLTMFFCVNGVINNYELD